MSKFGFSDLLIIYGFFIVFICIGVVFLRLGWINREKYNLSRRDEDAAKQMSAGNPFYDRDTENAGAFRTLEGDRDALFKSRNFLKTGIIFAGIGLLGIIVFTIL
ncbi:MAG: hypothetical protein IKN14_01125 [Clostridiales bacterium]|nr:hypothetical protein [Clostridiales bacterium]